MPYRVKIIWLTGEKPRAAWKNCHLGCTLGNSRGTVFPGCPLSFSIVCPKVTSFRYGLGESEKSANSVYDTNKSKDLTASSVNEKMLFPHSLIQAKRLGWLRGNKYCLETGVTDGLNISCEKRSTCYIGFTLKGCKRSPGGE